MSAAWQSGRPDPVESVGCQAFSDSAHTLQRISTTSTGSREQRRVWRRWIAKLYALKTRILQGNCFSTGMSSNCGHPLRISKTTPSTNIGKMETRTHGTFDLLNAKRQPQHPRQRVATFVLHAFSLEKLTVNLGSGLRFSLLFSSPDM